MTAPSIAQKLMQWDIVEESFSSTSTFYEVQKRHYVRVNEDGTALCVHHDTDHEGCAEAVEAARSARLKERLQSADAEG